MPDSVDFREPSEYACSWQKVLARRKKMKVSRNRVHEWMKEDIRAEINNLNEDEQPIPKKMMKTMAISIDHISSSSSSSSSSAGLIADDEDLLVSQIFTRLPVKSLTKFKCVSKGWKSMIEKDAPFINLHLARSEPRFLIVVAPPVHPYRLDKDENKRRSYDLSFLSADLHLNVDNVKRIQSSFKCLGPVRGLLCLVDRFAVQIFNVFTGELTPWLKPQCLKHDSRSDDIFPRPRFFFGIDPSSGKHKVLCLSWEYEPEVLTVGEDSSWRIIDDDDVSRSSGPDPFQNIFAYANGSVYWFEKKGRSESLVAFDVGSEKFRRIPIPIFTRLAAEGAMRRRYKFDGLIEMDGCLTLIRRRCQTVKMWKFHDYEEKDDGSNSEKEDWILVEEIKLHEDIKPHVFVYFHPIPGKRQLMLETYIISSNPDSDVDLEVDTYDSRHGQYFKRNVKFARFYLYDMRSKEFSRVSKNGVSSVPDDCRTTCAPLAESLLPVRNYKIS
ncbi:Putative F-box protein At1g19160 [Linum grandiflorum]